MYSILRNENRYDVLCFLNGKDLCNAVSATIDTGARYTCISAWKLRGRLTEKDLLSRKCAYVHVGGFVDGDNPNQTVRIYFIEYKN